eukprot:6704401-Prymnesium_polylepis.1
MDLGVSEGKRKRKRADDSIPLADAYLTAVKGEKSEGSPSNKRRPRPPMLRKSEVKSVHPIIWYFHSSSSQSNNSR